MKASKKRLIIGLGTSIATVGLGILTYNTHVRIKGLEQNSNTFQQTQARLIQDFSSYLQKAREQHMRDLGDIQEQFDRDVKKVVESHSSSLLRLPATQPFNVKPQSRNYNPRDAYNLLRADNKYTLSHLPLGR